MKNKRRYKGRMLGFVVVLLLISAVFIHSGLGGKPDDEEYIFDYEMQIEGWNISVKFSWSPSAPPTIGHGHKKAYLEGYRLSMSPHPTTYIPSTANEWTVSGLNQGIEYHANLWAFYDDDSQIFIGQVTFTTPEFYPPMLGAEEGSYQVDVSFARHIVSHAATGQYANSGIVDGPSLKFSIWGNLMYQDGKLYISMGNSLRDGGSPGPTQFGQVCWTDVLNPERISFGHYHNWFHGADQLFVDQYGMPDGPNGYPDPLGFKPHIDHPDLASWPTPAFVTDLPEGSQRFWILTATNNPTGIGLLYSDDEYASYVRSVQFLETDSDPISYHLCAANLRTRILSDYAYVFIGPGINLGDGVVTNTCILRCPVNLLNNENILDWHILEGFDAAGPVWSTDGATQQAILNGGGGDIRSISHRPNLAWSPYLNKWIACNGLSGSAFGPFILDGMVDGGSIGIRTIDPKAFVPGLEDEAGVDEYAMFFNEKLVTGNGRTVYTIQDAVNLAGAQGKGNYLFKNVVTPRTQVMVSQKCAVAGDVIDIYATNNCWPDFDLAIEMTVGGVPATFIAQNGNTFHYQYVVTGEENGGLPGRINVDVVASSLHFPMPPNRPQRCSVALIVNHYNDLTASITSHTDGQYVSDAILLDTDINYTGNIEDEVIEEGGPEKGITSVELWVDGYLYHRVVEPPYNFAVNTREFINGMHSFTVKAFDYLDRQAESTVTLHTNNTPQEVAGNLLADGNMEADGLEAWTVQSDVIAEKVGNGQQRDGGARALKLAAAEQGMPSRCVYQTVTGLVGGENLTLSLWIKTGAGRFASTGGSAIVAVAALDAGTNLIYQGGGNPNHYKKHNWTFTNPEGNTRLRVYLRVSDSPADGTLSGDLLKEAWFDDVSLILASSMPEVPAPGSLTAVAGANGNTLYWDQPTDITIEYTEIRRREVGQTEWSFLPLARLDRYDFGFHTGYYIDTEAHQDIDYEYCVIHVDATGQTGPDAVTTALLYEPIEIVSVCSVRDHGGTEFKVEMDPDDIEPRLGSVHKMEFTLSAPVFNVNAMVSCQVHGSYDDNIIVIADGTTTVIVEFDPALPDQDRCTITLSGDVEDNWVVRTLGGDVNQDGMVSTADYSSVKQRLGQSTDPDNCKYDVNTDGTISTADVSSIKQRLGNMCPSAP